MAIVVINMNERMQMAKMLLSIVVPAYNEEKNIPLVYEELIKNINKKRFDYEIIFINDGSVDKTWQQVEKISYRDSNVMGIDFSRNFGHHAALEAGLLHSKGDVIVMLDADLQHPPGLLPDLIKKYDQGYEIVNTVRISNEDAGWFKRQSSHAFYKLLNKISEFEIKDGEADFRLISRRVLDEINSLPESPKFYRGLVSWVGYDRTEIEYVAVKRVHGRSSYSLRKMIEFARLGLTSFSARPLKLIIGFGVTVGVLSAASLIVMIGVKLLVSYEFFSNNAILVMFLVFITGLLATLQGIVALYLVDIHSATKGRPQYIIRSKKSKKQGRG